MILIYVNVTTPAALESVCLQLVDFQCVVLQNVDNAELYGKVGVPFVMGTTGGDRTRLYKTVEESKIYAVISPQMGKQVLT